MNIPQLAKFTVFLSGTLLHEAAHYVAATMLADEVNFRTPVKLYQAKLIIYRYLWRYYHRLPDRLKNKVKIDMRKGIDPEDIQTNNRFGVEATWREGSSPIRGILYLIAPLIFLPFAYLFLESGLTALTTDVSSIVGWIQFIVGTQLTVAFMPTRDDFVELHKILSRTDYHFRIRLLGRTWSIGNKD
jgi:hypothetical protein